MNYSEVEEIFCLTDDRKYKYFFNKVVESEHVCGLKDKNGCRVLVFADTGGGGISVDALELKDELQHFLSTY